MEKGLCDPPCQGWRFPTLHSVSTRLGPVSDYDDFYDACLTFNEDTSGPDPPGPAVALPSSTIYKLRAATILHWSVARSLEDRHPSSLSLSLLLISHIPTYHHRPATLMTGVPARRRLSTSPSHEHQQRGARGGGVGERLLPNVMSKTSEEETFLFRPISHPRVVMLGEGSEKLL
ncbi:hypothetical protein E2C01_029186 [Portunus trituberculatus]|uniref:Uncharacterized protein n=1 Tax=Portunus trituberculatus TaxID=210409 RepID=A0A5B7EMN8_PORTR|nr:hypothetical protein [Portunus trituberculatus]